MKKSKLQVMIEFASILNQIKASKKPVSKILKGIRKQSNCAVAIFIFSAIMISSASAITYYSRTSGGNWNVNTTWSTVGYGNATNTSTFPQAGDIANIGNGYTIYINTAVACATINVGQGVSGIVEYKSTANFAVTVSGNVTVNTGAKFWYNTTVARTHTLNIAGNFANFGIVDFYVNLGQVVNLTFNGATNSTVNGSGAWDLNTVSLSKTLQVTTVDVQTNSFENAIRGFVGNTGTYIHNNAGSYSINPTAATFTIGPTMAYQVPMGTMWFASAADNVYLQGSLYVNGGTVKIGTTAGLQGLRSDQSGATVPSLDVSSGSLIVYGGITYGTVSAAEPFSFNMTGGTILLNNGATGTNRQVFFVTDVAGSVFTMSAGTITFEKPNIAGVTTIDAAICGTAGSVTATGGTMQFGDAATGTPKTFNFKPYPAATYPNFKVTGTNAAVITLAPSSNSTVDFKLLSLYIDIGKIFDIRSVSGTQGDSKQMTLLSTMNGSDAIYNNGTYTQRTSTVTFNTSGTQAIGGSNVTTFYNLAINNSSNITLNKAANVSNFLSMVNGNLLTNSTNILTCQSAANASLGSNTSFVDGPMIHTWATAVSTTKTFPIGGGVAYRPVVLTVKHSNGTSVTYRAQIFNSTASALPFTLPAAIANISNIRYVQFARQNVANFSNGTIQMYYDVDDGVANKNTLLVAHDDGVSLWQNFAGVATANWTGNITSGVFNNFHTYFVLGNPPGGGNPLPVELSSFNAKLISKNVNIDWITQSEINNDFFTVERSKDNNHYEAIGTVDGSGNTTVSHTYSFVDHNPYSGTSYYRLRQTDFDGHSTSFTPISISNKNKSVFSVYPNPSNGANLNLNYSGNDLRNYTVTVQDINGKTIPATIHSSENFGELKLEIDESYRKIGSVYIIVATNGLETLKQKLIIGKE